MNAKIISGLFVLSLMVSACVSEFNAKLPNNQEQILIVEGNIIENTYATFYLSKSFPLDSVFNPSEGFVNDAKLTIIGSDGSQSQPASNYGLGKYQIFIGNLNDDVAYGIQIKYNGNTYQSTFLKPLHTPEIDSVSWTQPEVKGTVFFHISTHDSKDGSNFYMWDYKEDWEVTAYYATTIFFNSIDSSFYIISPAPYYYCWKSALSNKFLIGSTESLSENRIINKQFLQFNAGDDRFSVLYCITVNQRAISKGAYEYYQNKITLNGEMGGLFTPQPSELSGNITCLTDPSQKVMGYVDVSKNATQKRLFVYSGEITRPLSHPDCASITQDSINQIMSQYGYTYADIYSMGYCPAVEDPRAYPNAFPSEWSTGYCTNCLYNGGTKNKPDFWPNNDQ